MTLSEVMKELEGYSSEQTKKTLLKHGAKEPFFGVKVQDLKKIVKKVKTNHELSLQLFATGNSDAMYLAGLIADENKITKDDLRRWAGEAYWYYVSEFTVPWVAAETKFGFELGLEWIESKEETIAACGWATLANCAAVKQDSELDIEKYKELLNRAQKEVHDGQNRVSYAMNAFVIAVGSYIKDLTQKSIDVGTKIGKVKVDMGGTTCKVPLATEYIQKVVDRGTIGKKRTAARC